jgi:Ca2+-binding RTX toxin-like protein
MDLNRKRRVRPEVESLEDRALLAVTPGTTVAVELQGKTLQITGTDQADTVRVFARGSKVVVEVTPPAGSTGAVETKEFIRGHVKTINFDGFGGDDVFINDLNYSSVLTIANGGEGNDQLEGGEGRNILSGGAGDDKLVGGHKNDQLSGDAGKDDLDGRAGADVLSGGEGADTLRRDRRDTVNSDAEDTILGDVVTDVGASKGGKGGKGGKGHGNGHGGGKKGKG